MGGDGQSFKQPDKPPEVQKETATPSTSFVTNQEMQDYFKRDDKSRGSATDGQYLDFGGQKGFQDLYGKEAMAGGAKSLKEVEAEGKGDSSSSTSGDKPMDGEGGQREALGQAIGKGQLGSFENTNNIKVDSTNKGYQVSLHGEKSTRPMKGGETGKADFDSSGKLTKFEDADGSITFGDGTVTMTDSNGDSQTYKVGSNGNLIGPNGESVDQRKDTDIGPGYGTWDNPLHNVEHAHTRLSHTFSRLGMNEQAKFHENAAGPTYYNKPGLNEEQVKKDIDLRMDKFTFGLPESASNEVVQEARKLADQQREKGLYGVSKTATNSDLEAARIEHLNGLHKAGTPSIATTREVLGIPQSVPDSQVKEISTLLLNRHGKLGR